jgi:hypothetical protein
VYWGTVPSLDDWEKEWGGNSQRSVQPKLLPVYYWRKKYAIHLVTHDVTDMARVTPRRAKLLPAGS